MLTVITYSLWLALPFMLGVIAYYMVAQRLYGHYPLFFSYDISHLLSFLVLFYCYHFSTAVVYRHVYTGFEVLDVVLKFGVICELFSHAFRSLSGIRELGPKLLRWSSV